MEKEQEQRLSQLDRPGGVLQDTAEGSAARLVLQLGPESTLISGGGQRPHLQRMCTEEKRAKGLKEIIVTLKSLGPTA